MKEEKQNKMKPYPSSNEAEQALLGCVIIGGEREQEVALAWIRDDKAFYYPDNKLVWQAFRELYKEDVARDLC